MTERGKQSVTLRDLHARSLSLYVCRALIYFRSHAKLVAISDLFGDVDLF